MGKITRASSQVNMSSSIKTSVVGYAGYKSYGVKPYSNFKPGQTTLQRDYYGDANQEKPSGDVNLQNYQRFGSDYSKGVSKSVKPGDYVVPSKDANNLVEYDMMNNPALFAYTRKA